MDTPESMKSELAEWNAGAGIDLDSWIGCIGRFLFAVGYASVFWPEFEEFEGYILRQGFSESSVRAFEKCNDSTPRSVEWAMNHLHIADIQHHGCEDISKDKIILLGNTLKEMWQAKLAWKFPDKPCVVEFYQPEDADDLMQYQISFWQEKHGHA